MSLGNYILSVAKGDGEEAALGHHLYFFIATLLGTTLLVPF